MLAVDRYEIDQDMSALAREREEQQAGVRDLLDQAVGHQGNITKVC